MSKGFTLIEVIVSVVLIFFIGLALNKISTANVDGLRNLDKHKVCLASAVINSKDEFNKIDSYLDFDVLNLQKYDYDVYRKKDFLRETKLEIGEHLKISYVINKYDIKVDDEKTTFIKIE